MPVRAHPQAGQDSGPTPSEESSEAAGDLLRELTLSQEGTTGPGHSPSSPVETPSFCSEVRFNPMHFWVSAW